MSLELIEPHPRRVLEAFREGDFDGIEIIGRADEKAFFELCFREKMLEALAQEMPTDRQKEEVPRWFVLTANLSLRLHGQHAFHAWPQVVRCGGLLSALPPALATKHLDPKSGRVLIHCTGFNAKNTYDRQAPCDQDKLPKYVKDVPAAEWQAWFNGPVQTSRAMGSSIRKAASAGSGLCVCGLGAGRGQRPRGPHSLRVGRAVRAARWAGGDEEVDFGSGVYRWSTDRLLQNGAGSLRCYPRRRRRQPSDDPWFWKSGS